VLNSYKRGGKMPWEDELGLLKHILECPHCNKKITLQEAIILYLKTCIAYAEEGKIKLLKKDRSVI